jgi:hypothetical protein
MAVNAAELHSATYRLLLPRALRPLRLPTDCLTCGQYFAQETGARR